MFEPCAIEDWILPLRFLKDSTNRRTEMEDEWESERGDDILALDWTKGAATRCGGHALLNAMDGARHILLSQLTRTCGPWEAEPAIARLAARGVRPKVVYVDDECCGAWATLLARFWPDAMVRLDGVHALMRLTESVTCTRHPWHGEFCTKLSDAIYTPDPKELNRLIDARVRDGLGTFLPKSVRNKFVPRAIINAAEIAAKVDAIIYNYATRTHQDYGPLLTETTQKEWKSLRQHILRGCLCDPPGVQLHEYRGAGVLIGGERFRTVTTLRGASALEGFHSHQKQWLGILAQHTEEGGQALLTDGALRWNRKRRQEQDGTQALPTVFPRSLLRDADAFSVRLTGASLYPALGNAGPNEQQ